MINKIIHLIWIGNNELPKKALNNIKKWINLNPNYEIKCWLSSGSTAQILRENKTLEINNVLGRVFKVIP